VTSGKVVSDLEGIQDGKEKIYEVARIETELELVDEDNKLIVLVVLLLHQGAQGDLTAIDLRQVLVVLEPSDEELYGCRGDVDLVRSMGSEGTGHVVLVVVE